MSVLPHRIKVGARIIGHRPHPCTILEPWPEDRPLTKGTAMADNIETKGALAAFASRAVAAWHNLGTVFDNARKMTTADMLAESHTAGWNVRLSPFGEATGTLYSATPDLYVVERDNPFTPGEVDALAVVGKRYRVAQNEEVAAFGDTIIEVSGGRWETMGSLDNGRRFFGALAFTDDIVLDPTGRADTINRYLTVASSHDGTMQVTAMKTNVRVVCANTLRMAFNNNSGIFTARHTGDIKGRIEDARAALGMAVAYDDAFEAEAKALIEFETTLSDFHKIVESVYPKPEADTKGAQKKWDTKIDLLESIYLGRGDQGDTMSNITGTAWGVLNALTERVDYYRNPRSDNPQGVTLGAAGFDANANTHKQLILNKVLAFTNA